MNGRAYTAPGCPGLALRAYAGRCPWGDDLQREQDQRSPVEVAAVQDDVGGFGNSSAGSVVEWNVPAAKVFFNDLITGDSVAGTA
jgi:hypothetical protein